MAIAREPDSKFNPEDWKFKSTHETSYDPDLPGHIKTAPKPVVRRREPDSNFDPPEDEPEIGTFTGHNIYGPDVGWNPGQGVTLVEDDDFDPPDDDPGPIIDRDCDYWNRNT